MNYKKSTFSKYIAKISVIIIFLIILNLFSGCNFLSKQKNENKEKPTKVFKSDDSSFQLAVPSDWKKQNLNVKDAKLQIANLRENMYCIVIPQSKNEFEDNTTLNDYYNLVKNNFDKTLKNVSYSKITDLKINNYKAKQFTAKGETDNLKIVYITTLLTTKDNFYQVIAWTLQDEYDKKNNILKNIANTFEEISK